MNYNCYLFLQLFFKDKVSNLTFITWPIPMEKFWLMPFWAICKTAYPQPCLDEFCFGSQIYHLLSLSVEFSALAAVTWQACFFASQAFLPLKQWLVGIKVNFKEILPRSETQSKNQIMTTWSALDFQIKLWPGVCDTNSTYETPLGFLWTKFQILFRNLSKALNCSDAV